MRGSLAGGGTEKGIKKALLSVDRVEATCIMVGLPGTKSLGPLFNNMIK
jgi:hypothetical protein